MDTSNATGTTNPADALKVEVIEPIGELVVGTGKSDFRFYLTALCVLNHPDVNNFLLKNKVKFTDRLTGTKIFPRDGMALPNGEVYQSPEPTTDEEQTDAS